MAALVGEPSRALPDVDFALGGARLPRRHRRRAAASATSRSTSFPRAISAARINLCITRRSHATVYASSSCRPFELAAARRGDRREPVRGDRALVRAGQRAARRRRRRRGGRRLPRPARRPGARPRSWAAARASGCSTSTPTATARAGCSSCSTRSCGACRLSWPCEQPLRPAERRSPAGSPIVPALQRGAEHRPRDRRAARLRPRPRGRRRLRRLGRPHGRGRRRGAARTSSALPFNLGIGGAVQTGFRYAWEGGYELAVRSTATASTTRPSCRRCSRRCSPTRPTSRRLAFHRRRRLPLVGAAPRRHPPARARRLAAIARQRVTDTTSGFQALNRSGDRALRRRLPARLSRGRGDGDGDPAPAAAARGAGRRCASASTAGRRSRRSRSIYYMVKVLLALFVGLFRRDVVPVEEA